MNNQVGIFISLKDKITKSDQLICTGRFVLPIDYLKTGSPGDIYSTIVFVINLSTEKYVVLRPFKNLVIFDDDLVKDNDNLSGGFNVNITSILGGNYCGEVFVHASIDSYLSDVKQVNCFC